MLPHHLLFHPSHLCHGCVRGISSLSDAKARQVAVGAARIADGHAEVALAIALQRHLCPCLRLVGHVLLVVVGRSVGIGVGIDAEYREVAGLSGPHPVICLTAKFSHRLGHGKHQSQVAEVAVGGGIVGIALIEGFQLQSQGGILLLGFLRPCVLHRVEQLGLFVEWLFKDAHLFQFLGHILLFHHKAHKHVFVGQFFLVGLGIEAIEHIVVLHGRVTSDGFKTAVVVGKHQSVGRYHHSRAVAAEVHTRLLDGVGCSYTACGRL